MALYLLCKLPLILLTAAALATASRALDETKVHRRTATKSNRTTDLITTLPGLNYKPGFRQYSGYFRVSENGRNIFYWYVESQNNPATDPVVLWTNGGPGCSGLIGLLQEHGPYLINSKLQLSPNPYSWNKAANMLYIEQPAGTGFSFSQTQSGYTTGDRQATKDNYQLILEFLKRFPERKSNDFYIASESYGGHYMPQLALEILSRKNSALKFKGMLVGNPFVERFSNTHAFVNTAYFHGVIPEFQYQNWQKYCSTRQKYDTNSCDSLYYRIRIAMGDGIDPYGLDYPFCTGEQGFSTRDNVQQFLMSSLSPQALQLERFFDSGRSASSRLASTPNVVYQPCSSVRATSFLNQPAVQRALHVNTQWASSDWSECSYMVSYNSTDDTVSQVGLYQKLVTMGKAHQHALHMLVFSGDNDAVVATSGTQSWIWQLGVNAKRNVTWVPWTVIDYQTAGYLTQFDLGPVNRAKFTFVTVHGAGHEVPAYRPKESLYMFKNFLSGKW